MHEIGLHKSVVAGHVMLVHCAQVALTMRVLTQDPVLTSQLS